MRNKNLQRQCSFCNNKWSINQGFNVETDQCKGCDEYDREKPMLEAERERQILWWENEGKYIEARLSYFHVRRN